MSKDKRKTLGEKIAEANHPLSGKELAAAKRDDYLRALDEELAGYKSVGKADRAKAVEAEIARVKKAPVGRGTEPAEEAVQVDPDPDDPADQKPAEKPLTAAQKRAASRAAKK
jgi:hypothetical protein